MSSKKQDFKNKNIDETLSRDKYISFRDTLDVEDKENDDDLTKALNKSVRIVDVLMDFFLKFFSLVMNVLGFVFRHAYLISVIVVLIGLAIVIS